MVPDENSMEDPLCNSSFGSMVSLDYVTPDTQYVLRFLESLMDSFVTLVLPLFVSSYRGSRVLVPKNAMSFFMQNSNLQL